MLQSAPAFWNPVLVLTSSRRISGSYRASSPGLLHRPRSSSAIHTTAVGHKLTLTLVTKRAVGAFADHGCVAHAMPRLGEVAYHPPR